MNKRNESELNRARGVIVFRTDHPLTPEIPRVTALTTSITTLIGKAESDGGNQVEGQGDFLGGSAHRRQLALALQSRLREIGRTARALPQDLYPGTREQFRVGSSLRYQQLIDVGNGFLQALGPIKAAFVERAYPADFDEKLAEQIDTFETATTRKARGKQLRETGTAGVKATMQGLKVAIDELDAILSVYYKASNPTLLTVWKNAKRVEYPAYQPQQPTAPPPSGGGTGGGSPLALRSAAGAAPDGAEVVIAGVEPRSNGTNGALVS
jgi:hypothetical protein